ncbi:MAG TPA: hypothetical protein VNM38_03275 [Solirubrobacterales bacterium]|nr:hypothetical protein [Solirubrobacterales bacterium]
MTTALVTAIALVLNVGCGSSNNPEETSPALTKAQFLKRGNEICEKRLEEKDDVVKAAVKKLAASGQKEASKQLQQEVGESVLSSYRLIANELGSLEPPAQDKDEIEALITTLEDSLDEADSDPSSVLSTEIFGEAAEAGRSYGLDTCNF